MPSTRAWRFVAASRSRLVADEASRDSGGEPRARAGSGRRCGDTASSSSRLRDVRSRRRPREVLDAFESADAGILCVQPQEGELPARMAIVGVIERRRIRYAHMVGVTPQIMREGMRADYLQVDRLSTQLCERMDHATSLTVRTANGTEFPGHIRSVAGVGQDERPHQSAILVELAGR